ncbi:MAG: hypothetical protein K1000chlam4_01090, partial [Chlamydiae bacterium]|nr:hypothetical protein [Chlamydiota bacterium]
LPIVFLSITSTISGMKDFQEMKRMGKKILTYTIGTTLVAGAVALLLFVFVNPVRSVLSIGEGVAAVPAQGSYFSFLLNIIPSNLFQAFAENNVIGIAFVAIMLSLAILALPKDQKEFLHKLFSSLFAALLKITTFVITLMPLAVWAFVNILAKDLKTNYDHFSTLMLYLACVIGANLIQGIIILPLMLKFKKISPWKSFKGMAPALTVAFFSKSSNAALPVAIRSAEENLGVSKKVSSFTLPLCSVINMNGCAAFILITTLFVSMLNGMVFGPFELVGWIFIATIAAIGNAGVPMGCFFLTSALLIGMKGPLYTMGLILSFYAIIYMVETVLNVWSDACITIAVDKDLSEASDPVTEPLPEVLSE